MLACWLLIAALSISNAFLPTPTAVSARDVWQKPGCHKVGKFFQFLLKHLIYKHFNHCENLCNVKINAEF